MLSSDGFRYFIIFMDDHIKFIWFYHLVAKSDVFAIFHQFQALVERQFSLKIKSVQTNWGGEYQKLNTYFKTIGIHHRVNKMTWLNAVIDILLKLDLLSLGSVTLPLNIGVMLLKVMFILLIACPLQFLIIRHRLNVF